MTNAQQKAAYRARVKAGAVLPVGGQRKPIIHGSTGGAAAHRRRGEQPCRECLTAESTARNERRKFNGDPV